MAPIKDNEDFSSGNFGDSAEDKLLFGPDKEEGSGDKGMADDARPAAEPDAKPKQGDRQEDKRHSEYDPYRVRDFLIRIAKAVKRHQIRTGAHQAFHNHVDKIARKMVSKKPVSEDTAEKDIDELKRRVSELISIEKGQGPDAEKMMKDRIEQLESKLNKILEMKQRKDERFKELERKIATKFEADQDLVNRLEKKLLSLERNLIEHQLDKRKSKKKVDLAAIQDIKQQINSTKAILAKHKRV